ncbi:MAG: hypothetical protein AAGI23_09445 [Bacteroidota bacterium]
MYVFIDENNQAANEIAQNVWFSTQHERAGSVYVFVRGANGAPPEARTLKINRYPTIVFLREEENQNHRSVRRIVGASTYEAVKAMYMSLLNSERLNTSNNNGGNGQSNTLFNGEGETTGFGLGIFDFSNPLTKWLWIAAGVYFVTQNKD